MVNHFRAIKKSLGNLGWKLVHAYGQSPPPCDSLIWETGISVAILTGPRAPVMEAFVKSIAQETGEPVDWSYFGGRAVVKTTGDCDKVRAYIRDYLMKFTPI